MLRIGLYVLTNLAVIVSAWVVFAILSELGLLPTIAYDNTGGFVAIGMTVGFGGSLASLCLSKKIAIWTTGARLIALPRNETEAWLVETVAELSLLIGVRPPDVAIYRADDPNAFATGWSCDAALVAVSSGLLEHLRGPEVRAILAHELSHVANGDMVTLGLMQGVLNTFVVAVASGAGMAVDRTIFGRERGCGPAYWVATLFAFLLLGVPATVVVMAFSRHREFRADADAASFVGRRRMIEVLQHLQSIPASQLPRCLCAFGIHGSGWLSLFASHPRLDERITRLRALG